MSLHRFFQAILIVSLLVQATDADRLELVRYTNLWTPSPVRAADAAGVTYVADRGHLLIADSEISEYGDLTDPATGERIYTGVNIFETTLDAAEIHATWQATPEDPARSEPVGIAWHHADGHVYVTDDDEKRIFRYQFDGERSFGRPVATMLTSYDGGYTDPEGIAVDPVTGDLLVVSGTKEERILRFRFDASTDTFAIVSDFSIGKHISDPEGIAIHPATGHIYTIASSGIGEFSADGDFVQDFDYGFLEGTGIRFTLPGGGTFAPTSDPNDARDALSLYVTCRGIDNGRFPDRNSLDGGLAELRLVHEPVLSAPRRVPTDYATIQGAVDAAASGDTILVAPGIYSGPVDLGAKHLALVSEHFLSGDPTLIAATVIDGGGSDFVLRVGDPEQPGAGRCLIQGFTLRNASDGITSTDVFDLAYCRVTDTSDGIDYEAGGGTVRFCQFDHNRDDAIDLDGSTAALIEQCNLTDNGDDGIEIRLHPHAGPDTLKIVVRDNLISGNGEDGIQMIGYDEETARTFHFEGNRIVGNAMAGIGLMSGANTREDYEAAPLPERILIVNNTFVDNDHHISGGAQVLIANNLLVDARQVALKGQTGTSLVTRNLQWGGSDTSAREQGDLRVPPDLSTDYGLRAGSGAIDAGLLQVEWQGSSWWLMPAAEVRGAAPDLGALERWVDSD
ncbi:MAG: hypothetical protein HN712_00380 [Gemmatimonadetes bacterium]|jgi:hypothetical protein|nr:hypothetical protein [Gemmatimonadota bacterium]MBT6144776.1 hypothetical protein [Gemmatimonadota bacterium]MBT7858724.1 hypothetical protein [Gemmatimonadota bacterium]